MDRLSALLDPSQTTWNGIDFVEITTDDQTGLAVHFLNAVPLDGTLTGARPVTISGGETVSDVPVNPVAATDWSVDADGRPVLALTTPYPGDFSFYELTVHSTALDPYYSTVSFSFKARCPSDLDCEQPRAPCPVLGDVPTGWCVACVPYAGPDVGFFFVPEVGAGVWIEFEGGDVSYPIWSGCYWRAGELPADASPTVRGLVTGAPHKLLFADDDETVTLSDANDNEVTLDSSGITQARGTQQVVVGDASVNINSGALEVT